MAEHGPPHVELLVQTEKVSVKDAAIDGMVFVVGALRDEQLTLAYGVSHAEEML